MRIDSSPKVSERFSASAEGLIGAAGHPRITTAYYSPVYGWRASASCTSPTNQAKPFRASAEVASSRSNEWFETRDHPRGSQATSKSNLACTPCSQNIAHAPFATSSFAFSTSLRPSLAILTLATPTRTHHHSSLPLSALLHPPARLFARDDSTFNTAPLPPSAAE